MEATLEGLAEVVGDNCRRFLFISVKHESHLSQIENSLASDKFMVH